MPRVGRRLLAEFTGTGLLVAVVVGSGIAATRLTTDGALQLLVNSLVTAMGLAVLIVVFIRAGDDRVEVRAPGPDEHHDQHGQPHGGHQRVDQQL